MDTFRRFDCFLKSQYIILKLRYKLLIFLILNVILDYSIITRSAKLTENLHEVEQSAKELNFVPDDLYEGRIIKKTYWLEHLKGDDSEFARCFARI